MAKKSIENKNVQKQELTFHLYYNPSLKKVYTRMYKVLLDTHNRTYEAIYKDFKENPSIISDKYLKEGEAAISPGYSSEDVDPSSYYEDLEQYVVERMQEQSLMYYQFRLMSLSNLYQVFEQQLRKWLFEEMTHNHNEYINQVKFVLEDEEKEYGKFYSRFGELQDVLKELNLTFTISTMNEEKEQAWIDLFGDDEKNGIEVPIVETDIWKIIRECNLISNTFKHGSGNSAKALYDIHPEYFETVLSSDTKLMNLYRTTNMEEVLNVDKIPFEEYVNAMGSFWENLKTNQSGSLMLKIDISSGTE